MKYLVFVSYNGTNYYGWQRQPNDISVQQVIEEKLSQYFNQQIIIYGAGRTDAGVHALAQTFHFEINKYIDDLNRFIYSLNLMLPKDIKFEKIINVSDDFHARFSAIGKEYEYRIILSDKDVFNNDFAYVFPQEFDYVLFEKSLTYFVGKKCFKNFTSKPTDKDNFIREIHSIDVIKEDKNIFVTLNGNGFMQYMVRFIIGTAVACATHKIKLDEVIELFDNNLERKIISFKAPAQGLYLKKVRYDFNS